MKQIAILICLGLFFACKKKTDPLVVQPGPDCSTSHKQLSEDVKKVNYKAGTYWVLLDSVSKTFDSLVVSTGGQFSTVTYPQAKGKECQTSADRLYHNVDLYKYDASGKASKSVEDNYVIFLVSQESKTTIRGYLDNYPTGPTGTVVYSDYDKLREVNSNHNISSIDSMFIGGHYFKRIIKASYTAQGSKSRSDYFFNTQQGFLKLSNIDSSGKVTLQKELVRYKIH